MSIVTSSPESAIVEPSDVDTPPSSQIRPKVIAKTPAAVVEASPVMSSAAGTVNQVTCVAPDAAATANVLPGVPTHDPFMAHAIPLVSTTLLPTSGLSIRQPMAYTGPDVGKYATSSKSVSDVSMLQSLGPPVSTQPPVLYGSPPGPPSVVTPVPCSVAEPVAPLVPTSTMLHSIPVQPALPVCTEPMMLHDNAAQTASSLMTPGIVEQPVLPALPPIATELPVAVATLGTTTRLTFTSLGVPLFSVPSLVDVKAPTASVAVAPASVPSSTQETVVGTTGQSDRLQVHCHCPCCADCGIEATGSCPSILRGYAL